MTQLSADRRAFAGILVCLIVLIVFTFVRDAKAGPYWHPDATVHRAECPEFSGPLLGCAIWRRDASGATTYNVWIRPKLGERWYRTTRGHEFGHTVDFANGCDPAQNIERSPRCDVWMRTLGWSRWHSEAFANAYAACSRHFRWTRRATRVRFRPLCPTLRKWGES